MTKCWQENPDKRPTFTELRNELKQMENQHKVSSWGIDFQLPKLISVIKQHWGCLSGVIVNQSRRLPFPFVDYNTLKKPSESIDHSS